MRAPTDDELITAWGLLHEALRDTEPLLLRGIDPCGKDMSGPWFEVLIRLQRSPEHRLPMSRLAREVSLSSGGFTKLADRLEHRGYLRREHCPEDRRVTYAALTDDGIALAEQARAKHVALLREHVLAPLGDDGLRAFADAARLLRDEARASADAERGAAAR
ncbi:DNA-binding MarR family transcriptional regulator [Murinocardiopsis flavida]|uniref:DNA-binding MarR family transcriptional regulator n=1 Tax=Murinocardiopsis flavida TaxID=645275 RepID=A0A2P8DK76_9ACTN|nr:DNA-binding MarR family transcriptional regulator [Murinocardiopsis flavida]